MGIGTMLTGEYGYHIYSTLVRFPVLAGLLHYDGLLHNTPQLVQL